MLFPIGQTSSSGPPTNCTPLLTMQMLRLIRNTYVEVGLERANADNADTRCRFRTHDVCDVVVGVVSWISSFPDRRRYPHGTCIRLEMRFVVCARNIQITVTMTGISLSCLSNYGMTNLLFTSTRTERTFTTNGCKQTASECDLNCREKCVSTVWHTHTNVCVGVLRL